MEYIGHFSQEGETIIEWVYIFSFNYMSHCTKGLLHLRLAQTQTQTSELDSAVVTG